MATPVGTQSTDFTSFGTQWSGTRSWAHTIPAGATSLLVSISTFQDDSGVIGSVTWDSVGVNEAATLVHRTTIGAGASADVKMETWAIHNPTAKSADISINVPAGAVRTHAAVAYCYSGTGGLPTFVEEQVNDDNTTEAIYAGNGTAGLDMIAAHAWRSGASVLSLSAPWAKDAENTDATASAETTSIVGRATAPQALTVSSTVNDENAGHIIEFPSAGKTATVQLADINGVNRANLSNVPWAWFDALPTTIEAPTDSGNGNTDANGNMTVDIPNSTLNTGQVGYLVIDTGAFQGIYAVTVT